MKQIPLTSCLLLLLAVDGARHVAEAQETTHLFSYRAEQSGQRSLVASRFQLKIKVDVKENGELVTSFNHNHARTQNKIVTVLATGENGPARIRVHYRTAEESDDEGDGAKETRKDPTVGKTYLVEHQDGRFRITGENGQKVSADEERILQTDNHNVGRPYPLAELLDGKRLAEGQKIDIGAEQARQLMNLTQDIGEVRQFAMTFSGTREVDGMRCAVFDTEIQIKSKAINSAVRVKGQYVIGIETCRLVSLDLAGPVTISGSRQNVTIDGTGTLHISFSVKYDKK